MDRLEGVIDLHIHTAPDIRERKMNDLEIMEAAVARKVRAVVIKSHHFPTMARAALVNLVRAEKYPESDFEMFGGVTLNQFTGGINPRTVEAALKTGAKIVWLPTVTAENHLRKSGKSGGVAVTRDGKVVPELLDVFQLVKDYDAVLETGHIAAAECFTVAEAARAAGVEKIIVTHPEFWIVGMSLEEQVRIVREYGVMLEHEYAQPIKGAYKKNLPDNVTAIREAGYKHTIVSTDSGQTVNPYWYDSIREYIDYLYDAGGFSAEQVDVMTKTNPGKMLGIL